MSHIVFSFSIIIYTNFFFVNPFFTLVCFQTGRNRPAVFRRPVGFSVEVIFLRKQTSFPLLSETVRKLESTV